MRARACQCLPEYLDADRRGGERVVSFDAEDEGGPARHEFNVHHRARLGILVDQRLEDGLGKCLLDVRDSDRDPVLHQCPFHLKPYRFIRAMVRVLSHLDLRSAHENDGCGGSTMHFMVDVTPPSAAVARRAGARLLGPPPARARSVDYETGTVAE